MNEIIWGLTPPAMALRLTIVVLAALGIHSTVEMLGDTMGPLRPGLIAIPYGWKPWFKSAEGWPVPLGFNVPLLCPNELSQARALDEYHAPTFEGPTVFVVFGPSIYPHQPKNPGNHKRIPGPLLGSQGAESGVEFCTYTLEDGSFLVVSNVGDHFRLDADFVRIDGAPALQRLGAHIADYPVKFALALALLVLGAWLVFRRKRVTWLSFVGCAIASCWLIPLGRFVQTLLWA